jgi:ADP-ribose pyrophosphatase YjhB (NUDIX family)
VSYIDAKDIEKMEQLYGKPENLKTTISATTDEINHIRQSQKHGRAHDITLFIFRGEKMLFIAKHFYPPGLYRAPSGAARPGETLIEGALREAYEETGTRIEIEKFLLKISAQFAAENDRLDWTSYVFKAAYVSGDIQPVDTEEIREAKLVDPVEIGRFNKIMLKAGLAGFRYRVYLTQNALRVMNYGLPHMKLFSTSENE